MAGTAGAKRAEAYGIAAYPTPEGDAYGMQKRGFKASVPVPDEGARSEPWDPSANADTYGALNRDAHVMANATGLEQPLLTSPKTAGALIKQMHRQVIGLPGQERARFLDGLMAYQREVANAMQALKFDPIDDHKPVDGTLASNYEAPAAAPQDAERIAMQMGEDPNAIRTQLVAQQQNPTAPQSIKMTGQGGPTAREPTHRQAPMPRPKPVLPQTAAAGPYTRNDVSQARGY